MALVKVTEELLVSKFSITLLFLNSQHCLAGLTILSFLKHLAHRACHRRHSPALPPQRSHSLILQLWFLSLCWVPQCGCLPELCPRPPSHLFLNAHISDRIQCHGVKNLYKQMTYKDDLISNMDFSLLKSRFLYPTAYLKTLLSCLITSNLTSSPKNSRPPSTLFE